VRRFLSPISVAAAVAVAAIVALLAYGIGSNEPDRGIDAALASGERVPAPTFTLPMLDGGGEASLADYRGRVVVLNYWASWCEPCRTESPLLQRWHERIERRGGTVVGVDVNDVTSDAQEFIREFDLTYPMLRDADGETQAEFGVVAYPETIVLDREGRIVALRRGPVDERFLEAAVPPLLEERG
jgi:cytochrome c biogenesis protein CcmG/thiol:disulfide interchange protein DsbE